MPFSSTPGGRKGGHFISTAKPRHKREVGPSQNVPRVSSKIIKRYRPTSARDSRLADAKIVALSAGSNTCWDTALAKVVVRSKVKSASVLGNAWIVAASKMTARPSRPTPKLLASMSDWVRTTSSFTRVTSVMGIYGR